MYVPVATRSAPTNANPTQRWVAFTPSTVISLSTVTSRLPPPPSNAARRSVNVSPPRTTVAPACLNVVIQLSRSPSEYARVQVRERGAPRQSFQHVLLLVRQRHVVLPFQRLNT